MVPKLLDMRTFNVLFLKRKNKLQKWIHFLILKFCLFLLSKMMKKKCLHRVTLYNRVNEIRIGNTSLSNASIFVSFIRINKLEKDNQKTNKDDFPIRPSNLSRNSILGHKKSMLTHAISEILTVNTWKWASYWMYYTSTSRNTC